MRFSVTKSLVLCTALLASQAMASNWTTKITETPNGSYTASLIHRMEPARNETVGSFKTKKEARKAAKAAKNEKDSVIAVECGNVGQPPCP
jgi:hypothetical protein